jgi:mannose-6-phosphate isomerase-like protein (cupin superfamily)
MSERYFVRLDDVPGYYPANHTGTINRRLIGPENVGSHRIELVHGTIEPGRGALPHAHPDIDQICYLLEGQAVAEIDGVRRELKAGDCCYFPAGKKHIFLVTGEKPAKLLVIYSPPYEENPERVVR